MTDSQNLTYEILNKLQEHFPIAYRRPAGPGFNVAWALNKHGLTPDDLLFADVLPEDSDDNDFRSGRIFLVTSSAVIVAEYKHAPGDSDWRTATAEDSGTLSVSYFSRKASPVRALRWLDRSLELPKDGVRESKLLRKGAISVTGDGWEVQLPGYDTDLGDEYFVSLRDALLLPTSKTRMPQPPDAV